jgi:tetratricopeptide (TPR) repeat protein
MTQDVMELITNRRARVAVVSNSSSIRGPLSAAMRDFGFMGLRQFQTLNELTHQQRVESIDWIVCICHEEMVGDLLQYQLEKLQNPIMRGARLSILSGSESEIWVPWHLNLGALSWQHSEMTHGGIKESISELIKTIAAEQGEETFVAGRSLRNHSIRTRTFEPWLKTAKRIAFSMPNQFRSLTFLGEAHLYIGEEESGNTLLTQAQHLFPRIEPFCTKLVEDYKTWRNTGARPDDFRTEIKSRPPLRCLIVESDQTSASTLVDILRELKVTFIETVATGEEAWMKMTSKGAPDVLITEWRLPGELSGLGLIQRMRAAGMFHSTIVVTSSLVKSADLNLLTELTVAHVVPKPLPKQETTLALRWVLKQDRRPTEQKPLERKISQSLDAGQVDDAERLAIGLFANPRVADGRKTLVKAQLALARGHMDRARRLIEAAIRERGSDSLATITTLGRTLLKLGDNQAALRCFEKAQTIQPKNIARLCELAEIHLLEGRDTEANNFLDLAKDIDQGNETIIRTEAKAHLSQNRVHEARELMVQIDERADIVAFMNNRAIALIRQGQLDEALQYYQRTLEALPSEERELSSLVHYNLGLAYARHQKLELAKTALNESLRLGNDSIESKTKSLLARVQRALDSGGALTLKLSEAAKADGELELTKRESALHPVTKFILNIRPASHILAGMIPLQPDELVRAFPKLKVSTNPSNIKAS